MHAHGNSIVLLQSNGLNKGSTKYLIDTLSQAHLLYDGSQKVGSEIESINMTQDVCYKTSVLFKKSNNLLIPYAQYTVMRLAYAYCYITKLQVD